MSCSAPSPELALQAEAVSKQYRVFRRPQDRFWQALRRGGAPARLWALRHVSFDVRRGEAVGILGRNGAGKSTLLQIIAGTLAPTAGRVLVRGRIAALLQLGAGFHPDFTGRENARLNGLIQGFSRAEMDERMESIQAFADIGSYIDRPVKTYSSGMYARLGFAVAMETEPEILIVDEILAVGDTLFQQKCITRIQQMREAGLTLLFVSHSVDRVNALCDRALLLQGGSQRFFGASEQAADLYLRSLRTGDAAPPAPRAPESEVVRRQTRGVNRYGSQDVRIADVRLLDAGGEPREEYRYGETVVLRVTYRAMVSSTDLNVSFLVRDETGVNLCGTMTWDEGVSLPPANPGDEGSVTFAFRNRLRPGRFGVCVALTWIDPEEPRSPVLFDQIDGVTAFSVLSEPKRPVHYKFDAEIEVRVP